MDTKNESSFYLQNISLFILAIFFFLFPLAISPLTTEAFAIPKQAVLATAALLSLSLLTIKMIADAKVRIKRSPFDLPIILLAFSFLLSAIFSINKSDAFIFFMIAFFAIIIYFTTLNTADGKNSIFILTASLLGGAAISSLISTLAFFKIYILPYAFSRTETFTPIGTLLDQSIYLAVLLPICIHWALLKSRITKYFNIVGFGMILIVSLVIFTGATITIYQLLYKQKPTLLPFETGFQTAFAAMSQDTGRTFKGFFFGSGVGTYSVDFSRFKPISFNQNNNLWSLTFFRSSSFVLELIATTGILGFLSFVLLLTKVFREVKNTLKNPMLISVLMILGAALILPLSFVTQALLFVLLALFAAYELSLGKDSTRFFDVDIQIVALRKGLLALEASASKKRSFKNRLLPIFLSVLVFAFVLGSGFYSVQFLLSDLSFQRSIVAASQNNARLTYQEQTKAINRFPYRDGYHRVYSQTNLTLADSLASQIKQSETPNQQTQQNIINLIQQSISSARTATIIAPLNSANWQNLSSIYRSLLGFGQNADQFAIATQKQAIILDPNNPLHYLTLGGIYYQLNQWDQAQNQFQIAIKLKPDYPNSYYNLGHVLEQKEEIEAALEQYEIVKNLVAEDSSSFKQITDEINALKNKKEKEEVVDEEIAIEQEAQGPLEIDQPSSKLPPQEPQVEIPPPPTESADDKQEE